MVEIFVSGSGSKKDARARGWAGGGARGAGRLGGVRPASGLRCWQAVRLAVLAVAGLGVRLLGACCQRGTVRKLARVSRLRHSRHHIHGLRCLLAPLHGSTERSQYLRVGCCWLLLAVRLSDQAE